MRVLPRRPVTLAICIFLLGATLIVPAFSQEISASPSSINFANTYVGRASGSTVITISDTSTAMVVINTIGFDCPGFGITSGIAPFTLNSGQKITHYSVFFQPTVAQTYNCNFVIDLKDGTFLDVPLTGVAQTTGAKSSVNVSSLSFPNQTVGTTSAGQTVTITNTGTSVLTLNSLTPTPLSFSTSTVTTPATIAANGGQLSFSVYYTPSQAISETGALDLTFKEIPDSGVTLGGNGVASSALTIATAAILPQATKSSAYETQLTASGGTAPYTWSVSAGSSLPLGLTLSSAGLISGTLDSSVNTGGYQFTVQATDSLEATASSKLTFSVYASLGDNCNDLSFNVPNTTSPIVALNDLGAGTYQGSEGGLYPNGTNVRPSAQDSYGVGLARGIQPLDSNGNPSPTGKYVLLAVGESTLQNEFNRFLPIALADPARNRNLVIVNGAQGGATPNNFTSTTSAYWSTTLTNYLPQNGVTANQVVAAIVEDTDGIATGSFPSDITTLQSQYESMMQTMLTLFPNLKMVFFGTRVYGGYSNGVGSPDNPEPYAYEVGFAVKWAIQDQLNGNANLNYNPALGPVLAPWMSWGTYYWSNGMLGRSDGLEWDCQDFSADGTHPSSTWGQLKVANALLTFLKTDDTTIPWYLAPKFALTATAGNNQSGNAGSLLPTALTAQATNTNGGAPETGVSVTFSDNGAGGTFGTPTATTDSNGNATSTYTLPATAKTVTISATSPGYSSATFIETATAAVLTLAATAGNNQTGNSGTTLPVALTVLATSNGSPVAGVSVTFSDGGVGGVFGTPVAITGSNGNATTTYTLPPTAQSVSISASSSGYTSASFTETAITPVVLALTATAGNNQTGGTGTTLPSALTVIATSNGTPVQGISVTFGDGGVGGVFGTPVVTTAADGTASTTYTLPATAQTLSITASSSGYSSATFSEMADVQALSATAGNNQTGGLGSTLPTSLTIQAQSNGSPVAGVSVIFNDGGAGGNFGNSMVTTDANGNASTTYTLPATAQTVTITASSSGYMSATFTETSAVLALTATAGNNQSGMVSTTLPTALSVLASSSGNPVSGVSVSFSDGGAGGVFGTPTAVTGSNGTASSTYTLPPNVETATITAASSGYTSASFTETSTPKVTAITLVSGGAQTGTVGTTLPLQITVKAKNGTATVSGAPITFSDGGVGGTFSPNPATTASNGQAGTSYTLPTVVKTVTVTAADGSISLKVTEKSVVGPATNFAIVSGNNQTAHVKTKLTKNLVVSLKDQYGNPVSGATVTFTDNGAGGTFSANSVLTTVAGQASVSYTTGPSTGTVTITAATGLLTPLSFTETVK
jgi:hypothetical protein